MYQLQCSCLHVWRENTDTYSVNLKMLYCRCSSILMQKHKSACSQEKQVWMHWHWYIGCKYITIQCQYRQSRWQLIFNWRVLFQSKMFKTYPNSAISTSTLVTDFLHLENKNYVIQLMIWGIGGYMRFWSKHTRIMDEYFSYNVYMFVHLSSLLKSCEATEKIESIHHLLDHTINLKTLLHAVYQYNFHNSLSDVLSNKVKAGLQWVCSSLK